MGFNLPASGKRKDDGRDDSGGESLIQYEGARVAGPPPPARAVSWVHRSVGTILGAERGTEYHTIRANNLSQHGEGRARPF